MERTWMKIMKKATGVPFSWNFKIKKEQTKLWEMNLVMLK